MEGSGEGQAQAESDESRGLPFPPLVGCAGSIAVGLAGVAIFFGALSLATRGDIRFARGELGETRFWLINESGNQGLGRSSTRLVSGSERSGAACLKTSVAFLMLRSEEPTKGLSYCECFSKEGDLWQPAGECPKDAD